MNLLSSLKLSLLTHQPSMPMADYDIFLSQAIAGGVSSIQFRDKTSSKEQLMERANQLKNLLAHTNTPLIINDHVYLAKEIDAQGVHLGQEDMHPDSARDILGPNKLIGLSIENLAQIEEANTLKSIDYIAASAVFPSANKKNCKTIWTLIGLAQLIEKSIHPVIAIGGINALNIKAVMDAGAFGVAIIGAIHDAKNPYLAARSLCMASEGSDV